MGKVVDFLVWLIRAWKRICTRKAVFLGLFAFMFFGSVIILGRLDLLPSSVGAEANSAVATSQAEQTNTNTNIMVPAVPELPIKIEIQAIGLSATISNPVTTDVEILDQRLLKGAVRYPTSAKLGEKGNVVLFGHSSYLPIVNNQAYKTFNGIQKLLTGDIVTVYSSGTAYTYSVKKVAKENANGNSGIPLSINGKTLTLVTCNSFAEKSDRFVVVADFVESHAISG